MAKIYLIGFMGSGKTFLGKQLAELLNCNFIDLDEEIEKVEGASIAEFFSSKGESYFRSKESSLLKSLLKNQNTVIATGGGTPCFHNNMRWMNEHGISVYLKVAPEILFQRLKPDINNRPLLARKSEEEIQSFIASTLHERERFYQQATLVINAETASPHFLLQSLTPLLN